MFQRELSLHFSTVLLCEERVDEVWHLRGYVVFWLVAGELQVLNVATVPEARRMGVARRTLEEVFLRARATKAQIATLELRHSNDAARRLYESLGFEGVGVRRQYYRDPLEDALLMTRNL